MRWARAIAVGAVLSIGAIAAWVAVNRHAAQVGTRAGQWDTRLIRGVVPSHRGDAAAVSYRQNGTRHFSLVDFATLDEVDLDSSGREFGPACQWSPDDRHIATVAHRDGWVAGVLNRSTLAWQPFPAPALDAKPTYTMNPFWRQSGDVVVFDAEHDDEKGRPIFWVCLHQLGRAESVPVARGSIVHSGNPIWRDCVIVSRADPERPTRRRFFLCAAEELGASAEWEEELLPGLVIDSMSASPDGETVVALCKDSDQGKEAPRGRCRMLLMSGPSLSQVAAVPSRWFESGLQQEWSPDGKQVIAYLWSPDPSHEMPQVAVVDVASRTVTPLVDSHQQPIRSDGAWFVDGGAKMIYAVRVSKAGRGSWEVWEYSRHSQATVKLLPPGRE